MTQPNATKPVKLPHPNDPPRVMVVEDEPRLRDMLLHAVPSMGFECVGAKSAEEAMKIMEDSPRDLLVLDLNLPGMDGLTFFELVREKWPRTKVVIVTGFGDLDAAKKAIRLDVADFLTKPCPLGDLERAMDRARQKWAAALDAEASAGGKGLPRMAEIMAAEEAAEIAAQGVPEEAGDPDQMRTLRDIEREHILAALERNDGNRAATAKELGISVRKLYYRISQYQEEGFLP